MITITLDAMSGDNGLLATIPGAIRALEKFPDLTLILVGIESEIKQHLPTLPSRIKIQHASEVVQMDDLPSIAMRQKKDSSMRVAINLVKEGRAGAVVSAGNTGALMAISRFVLKTHKGIDRPVLCTSLPSKKGPVWMLDLGANIEASAEQLLQFGLMGNALVKILLNRVPTVGLLNIGEEEIKGNDNIKKASQLLKASPLDYRGFVEGDDIFKYKVDLVVCDGFVGNVALKSIEGVAHMVQFALKREFTRNWYRKLIAILATPILKGFKKILDPRVHNGASLLGLRDGLVVKSHGNTDALGMLSAIEVAYYEVKSNLSNKIKQELSRSEINEK